MDFQVNLQKYANVVIHAGCNIQQGQELMINAPITCAEFVRTLTESAYRRGASVVTVNWSDEKITRLKYDYCAQEIFESVPEWIKAMNNGIVESGGAVLTITASDPEAFKGVDPRKPAAWIKSTHKECKAFYDSMDMGKTVWCIAAAPSPAWAKKVFPDCDEETAISKLWEAIFKAVRADTPDPMQAWDEHHDSFQKRVAFLNERQFSSLHYTNSLGTDITIGMTENHLWVGGGDRAVNGTYFFPNMPTEEIFCTPHKDKADGIVYSAMPLNYQGNLITDFSITFKDGRITDYSAKEGYDTLKELIESDEGSHHLGEVALVPKKSPISEMNILFYNTLYDENASCHFAVGKGFAECLSGGREMSDEEQTTAGINHSATHVDFMLGTHDLSITGIDKDGNEVPIFTNGNWAFEA